MEVAELGFDQVNKVHCGHVLHVINTVMHVSSRTNVQEFL